MAFAALTIDLNARLAKFEQDMARAGKSLDGLNSRATAAAAGLKTAFGAIGATLSVGALASFAKAGIDAADAMNDLSLRTGVGVETLAGYKLAAEQSGTSLEALGKGIQKLSVAMGEAEGGSKEKAAALTRLGVSARDPKVAFEQLADAVANSNDPIRTNADLQKVLSKNYAELLPLLQGGAQGLRDSAAASTTFAEQMARLAPDADRFNDMLVDLKINAAGAAASILSELVPSLNEYIAVGKEVVKNGTMLDKVRFFGLGNASDDLVKRVRINLAASAGWMDKLRASADAAADGRQPSGSNGDQLACIASGGVWDGKKCVKKASSAAGGPDKDGMWASDLADAWKEADRELKQYLDDERFIAEGDLERANDINAIAQSWEEAGRALSDAMLTPIEKANLELGRLDEMLERGVISWETYSRATFKTFEELDTPLEKTKSLAEEIGLTFTSAFEDAIVSGGDFSDVLKGLEQDIARLIIRKSVTEPLANAMSGIDFGAIFSSFIPSANGNVFASAPALSAYSGSVVSRPTVFPFANGIGLMGEAGAEAILPLKRGADGKLGVAGGGSSVQVNVINNASGTQATATTSEENGVQTIDIIVEQVEGKMSRNLGAGRGIAPSLERRYGLNPAAGAQR